MFTSLPTYVAYLHMCLRMYIHISIYTYMGWLRLVGSLKLYVSFAKEPYKRNDILHKRPIILSSLLIVAAPYHVYTYIPYICIKSYVCSIFTYVYTYVYTYMYIHI